jgi:hypothetical protein
VKKVIEFIKKLQSDKRISSYDEAAIKQAVVLKILSLLDWDPFDPDEVQPEHMMDGTNVDFLLRYDGADRVFVFVKKGEELSKFQGEALTIAVVAKVTMALLTDGLSWWFFLPLLQGSADEKKFLSLDLDMNTQRAEDIAEQLSDFLSKDSVVSGKAQKAAEGIYNTRQRAFMVKENLPKAWDMVMKEPKRWLVDVLAEATEEISGYKPDRSTVEEFISSREEVKAKASPMPKPKPSVVPIKSKVSVAQKVVVQKEDYATKSIKAFMFKGKRCDVKSWKAMITRICETIFPQHKDELEVLFTLSGKDKEYFSRNPYEFLNCEKISGTNIYLDVGLGAKEIVALAYKLILLFGYKESDLVLEVK